MPEPIQIQGLREFNANLKKLDNDLPRLVRLAFNEAADAVVSKARPRVPKRSGKAKGSVKARSTRTEARVIGGSKRVPYYPWLDFGGHVGRARSIKRPFLKEGRYIYRAYGDIKADLPDRLEDLLVKVANAAGIEVTR